MHQDTIDRRRGDGILESVAAPVTRSQCTHRAKSSPSEHPKKHTSRRGAGSYAQSSSTQSSVRPPPSWSLFPCPLLPLPPRSLSPLSPLSPLPFPSSPPPCSPSFSPSPPLVTPATSNAPSAPCA